MSQSLDNTVKASNEAAVAAEDPDFITYLLDPEQEYNCYFVVGNPALGDLERIGVVKKMLLAHSSVLRAELQDSKIAEKNDVKVTDLYPQTFKNLLRYVYGYDNTASLGFDEADNLLYAAEKYLMPKLKKKLAVHLGPMLNSNNICSLMNNPAVYTVLELDSAITEILQTETDKVLASPQFNNISPSGFLRILEQEVSNVREVELWRAAIKWAKNQGGSEKGEVLRKKLTDHLQHIRVCSMTDEEILADVLPTKVLTYDELILVSESRQTKTLQPNLTTICNVIEERDQPLVRSELLTFAFYLQSYYCNLTTSKFTLKTKDALVELCSAQLINYNNATHQCNCTISITRDTESPIVVRFEGQIDSASDWTIPILRDKKNIQLLPNSLYSIRLTFTCSNYHEVYRCSQKAVSGSHFSVDIQTYNGYYVSLVNKLLYKIITKKKRSALT